MKEASPVTVALAGQWLEAIEEIASTLHTTRAVVVRSLIEEWFTKTHPDYRAYIKKLARGVQQEKKMSKSDFQTGLEELIQKAVADAMRGFEARLPQLIQDQMNKAFFGGAKKGKKTTTASPIAESHANAPGAGEFVPVATGPQTTPEGVPLLLDGRPAIDEKTGLPMSPQKIGAVNRWFKAKQAAAGTATPEKEEAPQVLPFPPQANGEVDLSGIDGA